MFRRVAHAHAEMQRETTIDHAIVRPLAEKLFTPRVFVRHNIRDSPCCLFSVVVERLPELSGVVELEPLDRRESGHTTYQLGYPTFTLVGQRRRSFLVAELDSCSARTMKTAQRQR